MPNLLDRRWGWALAAFPDARLMYGLLQIRNHTMTSVRRAKQLWHCCLETIEKKIPGDFVECGVWKGGSSGLMALAAEQTNKKIHLYDSFEGLPEPSEKDGTDAADYSAGANTGHMKTIGKCVGTLTEVKKLMEEKLHIEPSRLVYHVGWFKDTLSKWPPNSIALLRLDGDWYESTRLCLEFLYPAISAGGFIIIDDYFCWRGCALAVDEFREKYKIVEPVVRIDHDSAFWRKQL
jgi:O-methyltransferase